MKIPAPVDPAQIPTLSGVFAPVPDEHDVADLTVQGAIPADLRGAYLRNGPNPQFPPLGSYTFPLEGDAMLHGIFVDDDRSVRYRNRFVWTPQMRLEQQAGHALWAGIMTPYFPGPDVVPAAYANNTKAAPFINIVHHGGRWLALSEVDPPWQVTDGMEVVGDAPFTWDGAVPGMCAHPKIDPSTGEMVIFRYDLSAPFLFWATIAPGGSVARAPEVIDVDGSYMIHDFTITERYVVLFVAPAQFDLEALISGSGPPLAWHGDKPLRIAVIPRATGVADVTWIETDPFWVYHYANAFDDGNDIVVDFSRWSFFSLGGDDAPTGSMTRARITPAAGTATFSDFDQRSTEFPRIDDRLTGRPHRFFTVSVKSGDLTVGEWNGLVRVDTHTGALTEWDSGSKAFGELVFAPAAGGGPDQGYYVGFRTDMTTLRSDWVVLDASDLAAGPVATVELPFRVPAGLHGNWFTGG